MIVRARDLLPGDMVYVGSTKKSLDVRLKEHLYEARHGASGRLYDAMRDYDSSLFEIISLETLQDESDLSTYEELWINELSSTGVGYNTSKRVAARSKQAPMTDERRAMFCEFGHRAQLNPRASRKVRVVDNALELTNAGRIRGRLVKPA